MKAILVIMLSDGKHRMSDIAKALDLPKNEVEEIIQHGERRGYIKIVSAYQSEDLGSELQPPEA
jgi:DNA-binding Lrp family transcriptional regulator